jgi:cyanoexosortase B-associated protein
MLPLTQSSRRSQLLKILVVIFVLAIAAVNTLPNYITGQWIWVNPPKLEATSQLQTLQKQGVTVPGWQTIEQQVSEIGGHKWSIQVISSETSNTSTELRGPVILMMRPQTFHKDQPQVDWMDINGVQHWTADHQQILKFSVNLPNSGQRQASVNARFFRGWNQNQTYAVLQWYSWSNGGSPSPGDWFWADQLTQLRLRQRMPWVAISILIPIKPLGEIELVRPLAESLGQTVQSTLMQNSLKLESV